MSGLSGKFTCPDSYGVRRLYSRIRGGADSVVFARICSLKDCLPYRSLDRYLWRIMRACCRSYWTGLVNACGSVDNGICAQP